MPTRQRRIAGLDVLRGLAAFAVMLHHHGQYYDHLYVGREPLPVNFFAGHYGVELFFIISGFVIVMTTERKRTVREFAASRFARLMPAFVAALVLASVILSLFPMPPLDAPTVRQFIANLTMASTLFNEPYVDLPYWSLTYELIFYILIAIALALGWLRHLEWLGLLALAVGLAFWCAVDVRLHNRTATLLLVGYANFFLIGICLYRLRSGSASAITYVALVLAIGATALGGGERSFDTNGGDYLALTIAFTILVWFATGKQGNWLAWWPLIFLGRISYPLYLVHVSVGFPIIRWTTLQGWSTAAGVVAAGAVSLAVACLIHYLIEDPAERWLRRRFMHPAASLRSKPAE